MQRMAGWRNEGGRLVCACRPRDVVMRFVRMPTHRRKCANRMPLCAQTLSVYNLRMHSPTVRATTRTALEWVHHHFGWSANGGTIRRRWSIRLEADEDGDCERVQRLATVLDRLAHLSCRLWKKLLEQSSQYEGCRFICWLRVLFNVNVTWWLQITGY